jgi:hypothetical protein
LTVAANVPPYVDSLLRAQQQAANVLGTNVLRSNKELYAVDLTLLTLLGMVLKALNDKGVVLDAEWQTRLNTALDGAWPPWIVNQTDPP